MRRIIIRKLSSHLLMVALSIACTACASTNKVPEYMGSHLLPPLDVPPELDKPVVNERMKIPDASVAKGGKAGGGLAGTGEAGSQSIEKPPEFIEDDDAAK